MKVRLDPERAFPAEVLALRDAGVPLPTWFAGPIYRGTREDVTRAMVLLAEVRADVSERDAEPMRADADERHAE